MEWWWASKHVLLVRRDLSPLPGPSAIQRARSHERWDCGVVCGGDLSDILGRLFCEGLLRSFLLHRVVVVRHMVTPAGKH